jgi:hypothetical protein
MHFEFEHLGTTTPFELAEGQHQLGGSPEDHVRLEGLPPGLLTLTIEGARLTVEAAETFTVNDVFVPRGVARLVLPGEVVGLPEGMRLKVLHAAHAGERGVGTVAVLKHLLTDSEGLVASRAPTLTCLTGLDVGRIFTLAEARTDIGRGADVHFRLRDRAVSRTHARIVREGSAFTVQDLGSPNGVFVNGHRVRRAAPLSDGDTLEVGQTILRFQGAVEEPPPTPVPAEPPAPVEQAETPAPAPDMAMPPERTAPGGWWLIGLGAATALAGVLVTYALVS